MSTRRLLVTGATGYLGRAVMARAVGTGVGPAPGAGPAAGTDRDAGTASRWEVIAGTRAGHDLSDTAGIDAWIGSVEPDVIIHTAAVMAGPQLDAVTTTAAVRIAQAAARRGTALVHLSTDVVFPGDRSAAYTEADEPRPVHAYGRAKAAAEAGVRANHPDAVIVRTSLLYGLPTTIPGVHEHAVADALTGRPYTFFSDEVRCPVHVDDLAAVVLALAEGAAGGEVRGPVHAVGTDAVSRYEFARLVAGAMGGDPDRLQSGLAAELETRLGPGAEPRPRHVVLDATTVTRLVPYRLRGVYEVLGTGR